MAGNVVVYLSTRGARERHSVDLEALRTTLGQLDELGCRLQQLSPDSGWPPQEWMIASTPLRMRLTGARKRLDYLATMNPVGEQDAIRWTLELHDACTEAEQHLHYIDASLHTLQRTDATPADRAREMEIFASSRSEFLKALREIRYLIAQQFPTVLYEH